MFGSLGRLTRSARSLNLLIYSAITRTTSQAHNLTGSRFIYWYIKFII